MNNKFIELAESIKSRLESRFTVDQLQDNYIYETLNELISEFRNGKFKSTKTDIGIAAVKLFDSNKDEDNNLVNDLAQLAKLYKQGY